MKAEKKSSKKQNICFNCKQKNSIKPYNLCFTCITKSKIPDSDSFCLNCEQKLAMFGFSKCLKCFISSYCTLCKFEKSLFPGGTCGNCLFEKYKICEICNKEMKHPKVKYSENLKTHYKCDPKNEECIQMLNNLKNIPNFNINDLV